MPRLTTKARDKIPAAKFGLPKERAYPMPDRSHARDAKSRASEETAKGKLSRAQETTIDRKANRILGEKGAARKEVRR